MGVSTIVKILGWLLQAVQQRRDGSAENVEGALRTGAAIAHAAFGEDPRRVLRTFLAPDTWQLEAGADDYIELCVDVIDECEAAVALRAELNRNLDRIQSRFTEPSDVRAHVAAVVERWAGRLRRHFSLTVPDEEDLREAKRLLTSRSRLCRPVRWASIFSAFAAVCLFLKAAMLTLGAGVGLLLLLRLAVMGVPFVTVASLVGAGVLLALVSRELRSVGGGLGDVSRAIQLVYGILDRTTPGVGSKCGTSRREPSRKGRG